MSKQPDRATVERIVRRWRADAELVRSWDLDDGSSATMTAVEVADGGGRERIVVRQAVQAWHDAASEHRVLTHLAATDVPAPRPLLLDESRELLPAPYLVTRYIEGAWTVDPPDRERFARGLADGLAAIHRAPLPAFELPSAATRAETLLGRSERSPARDTLAAAWPPPPAEPRLLHGDYWPCNVLWHESRIAGVIDWEDAARGDPLSDLAICRLDLTLIVGADVRDAFSARYLEATATDPASLPY